MELKREIKTDVAIVGSGPAGLSAANAIAKAGGNVVVFDENYKAGGQLFKQIHKFFGSSHHSAGKRGIHIGEELLNSCIENGVEIYLDAVVYGIFPGNELGVIIQGENYHVCAKKILIATGATEKALAFEGWDIPGVMGAGAYQTMMNIHHILPGEEVVMIGSGNVGLVVGYQIMQAGGKIKALVEAAPNVSGYRVHADKLRRLGVDFYTSHTIKKVVGTDCVEKVVLIEVDKDFQMIEGTEKEVEADTVCIAVGLIPSTELLKMVEVEMTYLPKMGGFIPLHNEYMQTSNPDIYVAGDAAGIEEASSAMEEGKLSGIAISYALGLISSAERTTAVNGIMERLSELRMGKHGEVRRENNEEIIRRYYQWKEKEK